jgi:hypothetical protein
MISKNVTRHHLRNRSAAALEFAAISWGLKPARTREDDGGFRGLTVEPRAQTDFDLGLPPDVKMSAV